MDLMKALLAGLGFLVLLVLGGHVLSNGLEETSPGFYLLAASVGLVTAWAVKTYED